MCWAACYVWREGERHLVVVFSGYREGGSIEESDTTCTSVPRGSESSSAVTFEL